jgi:hypothetical protein
MRLQNIQRGTSLKQIATNEIAKSLQEKSLWVGSVTGYRNKPKTPTPVGAGGGCRVLGACPRRLRVVVDPVVDWLPQNIEATTVVE